MRVAIVDSRGVMGDFVAAAVRRRSWAPMTVTSTDEAVSQLPFDPNGVVLVTNGGEDHAISVGTLRQRFAHVPLLVVSDERWPSNRSELLQRGANDVVGAPADPFELLIKLERWSARPADEESRPTQRLTLADLDVDLARFRAIKNGTRIETTALELRVLYCLLAHHPNLVPLERFLVYAWGSLDDPNVSLVRTHISHIRKKLAQAGGTELVIRSRHGVGYQIALRDAETAE